MIRRVLGALALTLVACGPGDAPQEHVERTRVIAARVHASGDETRASLLAGESATIEYLVVSPLPGGEALAVSFAACRQAPAASANGVVGCADASFGLANADVPAAFTETFRMPLDVPSSAGALITQLATCVGASALLDPDAPSARCEGEGRADLHRLVVSTISDVASANHNPSLRDERHTLDDAPWTEPLAEPDATGCGALEPTSSLPRVHRGADVVLGFGSSPDDRETYDAFDADAQPIVVREMLELVLFATLGEVDDVPRIDDDARRIVSTTWSPPTDADLTDAQRASLPSGLLVRLWLVARDRRGGADWLERDLCLVP